MTANRTGGISVGVGEGDGVALAATVGWGRKLVGVGSGVGDGEAVGRGVGVKITLSGLAHAPAIRMSTARNIPGSERPVLRFNCFYRSKR
jgi:hypothetical protein